MSKMFQRQTLDAIIEADLDEETDIEEKLSESENHGTASLYLVYNLFDILHSWPFQQRQALPLEEMTVYLVPDVRPELFQRERSRIPRAQKDRIKRSNAVAKFWSTIFLSLQLKSQE